MRFSWRFLGIAPLFLCIFGDFGLCLLPFAFWNEFKNTYDSYIVNINIYDKFDCNELF